MMDMDGGNRMTLKTRKKSVKLTSWVNMKKLINNLRKVVF
jgi:hypothetical protein